jgi:membrane-associated phospholipid phosphatase
MLRVSEWVLAAYYAYTTLLAVVLPIATDLRARTWIVNACIVLVYAVVLSLERKQPREWHSIARDWIPMPLMLLAYKEMGWFAPSSHDFHLEQQWIIVDRLVLRDWGLQRGIESLGWLIPALLELCYLLVYAVPAFTIGIVYAERRREQVDNLLTIYLLGLFLAYAQFPFWPSEPPRTVFPNEDLPNVVTVLRRASLAVVGGYGIHTSVFPSAHVSGAFAAAFAIRHVLADKPWIWRGLFIYAILIAVATVYGRYHYVVDGLAGFAMGVIALWIGRWLLRWRHGSEQLV